MTPTEDSTADSETVRRRWVIRLLVGLGFGIPIAIEGATFFGMLESGLLGGGGDDGGGAGTDGDGDGTGSPGDDRLAVGEEVLPETPAVEELRSAVVLAGEEAWRFRLLVAVENVGSDPYTLRIDRVTTDAGTVVEESAGTDAIAPGETGRLEHTWTLPVGEAPAWLTATGVTTRDGESETVERRRRLAEVPVGE